MAASLRRLMCLSTLINLAVGGNLLDSRITPIFPATWWSITSAFIVTPEQRGRTRLTATWIACSRPGAQEAFVDAFPLYTDLLNLCLVDSG